MKAIVPNRNSLLRSGSHVLKQRQACLIHMSSIYRPINVTPPSSKPSGQSEKGKHGNSESLSKSLKLLVDNGLIKQSSCFGAYHLLPIGLKAMDKLIHLVDKFMHQGNCQKIQMPTLTSASLWKATGRLEECQPELMRVTDRHRKEFLLSPTHEEAICDLVKNPPLSYRQLPLRLYQITEKFRDEMRPRFGLMRGRQFLMKDLYTFDEDLDSARKTYNEINNIYQRLMDVLDVSWVQARGSTGSIGGVMSHEFHVVADIGEDHLYHCASCKESFNAELSKEDVEQETIEVASGGTGEISQSVSTIPVCINCGSNELSSSRSIEVGHAFLLSTKYTKPLEALCSTKDNKKLPMEMGCYGLGVSRLLAALLEVKSTNEEIVWPLRIAPYLVSVLPPKQGSKEDPFGSPLAYKLYESLKKILPDDVIYDDRINQTIGKRLQDNKRLGIPFIIVCGKAVHDPLGPFFELIDCTSGSTSLQHSDKIVRHLYDVKSSVKLR